jgi:hypothetical protein
MTEIRLFYAGRLGPQHPYTLVCANDLAIAERAAGRFKTAQEWLRPTVSSLTTVLGDPGRRRPAPGRRPRMVGRLPVHPEHRGRSSNVTGT